VVAAGHTALLIAPLFLGVVGEEVQTIRALVAQAGREIVAAREIYMGVAVAAVLVQPVQTAQSLLAQPL
jgi:hypothetical protein